MAKDKAFTIGFDEAEIQRIAQSMQEMGEAFKVVGIPTTPGVPKQAVIKSETDPNLEALLVEVNRRIDAAYEEGYRKGYSEGQKDWDSAADWERELLRTWREEDAVRDDD